MHQRLSLSPSVNPQPKAVSRPRAGRRADGFVLGIGWLLGAGAPFAGAAEKLAPARAAGHFAPCAFAHYSFGTAVDAAGQVLFTEFSHRKIRRWNPQTGQFGAESAKEVPGLFGLAAGAAGELFAGLDLGDVGNPGKILRLGADGSSTAIVEKITRPRQLSCDAAGNLYAALEGGQVLRWDRAAGTVAEVMRAQSPVCGIAVGPDGSIYVSEYGVFDTAPEGYSRPLTPGQIKVKRPGGEIAVLAKGFWRARGLALLGKKLYLCTESDREDHGNAGLLVRVDRVTGAAETLLDDLDYPQFPAASPDGRLYFTLGRDNYLGCYDPAAPFREVAVPPKLAARLQVRGGNLAWEEAAEGTAFVLRAQTQTLSGRLQRDPGSTRVDGWLEMPAGLFQLSRQDLYPEHDAEHPGPGLFELPKVESSCASGQLRVEIFPLRSHQGCRWPMRHVGTSQEAPAEGFSEQPEAFRLYFCWTAGS